MKKKVKYIILFLIIILGIILIFNKTEVTEKVKKLTQKAEQIGSNEGNITTIDITGITPSPESQHEHIYKTHYDDTKHWEECTVCGIRRSEIVHSFTTTWTLRV